MADTQPGAYSRSVERYGRHAAPGSTPGGVRAEDEPAVRDAAEIVARIAADEAAADLARERCRTGRIAPISPDPRVAALLEPGEVVIATRASAVLERREPRPDTGAAAGLAGELYVTSRRLLLVGRVRLSMRLEEIEEAVLSGERLLLVLPEGRGVSLEVSQPRLLRVEIAAARASTRT